MTTEETDLKAEETRECPAILKRAPRVTPTDPCRHRDERCGNAAAVVAMEVPVDNMRHDALHGELVSCSNSMPTFLPRADRIESEEEAQLPQRRLPVEYIDRSIRKPKRLFAEDSRETGSADLNTGAKLFVAIRDVGASTEDKIVQTWRPWRAARSYEAQSALRLTPGMTCGVDPDERVLQAFLWKNRMAGLAVQILGPERVARTSRGSYHLRAKAIGSHLIRHCHRCRENFSFRGKPCRSVFVRNSICVISSSQAVLRSIRTPDGWPMSAPKK